LLFGAYLFMPELPEVETIARQLKKEIVGWKIAKITTDCEKQFKPSFKQIKSALIGQTVVNVLRRAKLLTLELSSKDFLLVHLKMSGSLRLTDTDDLPERWQHAVFVLEKDGRVKDLRWIDLRKFGYLQLVSCEVRNEIWEQYGPEPLTDLTVDYLQKAFARKSISIKLALLDQEIIAGIGNIYANEALFLSKIGPQSPAKSLSKEQLSRLVTAITQVLRSGIAHRGTTASDERYVDALGQAGENQNFLKVYDRAGQPCLVCGTVIEKIKMGGRGTYFCPRCQKREV